MKWYRSRDRKNQPGYVMARDENHAVLSFARMFEHVFTVVEEIPHSELGTITNGYCRPFPDEPHLEFYFGIASKKIFLDADIIVRGATMGDFMNLMGRMTDRELPYRATMVSLGEEDTVSPFSPDVIRMTTGAINISKKMGWPVWDFESEDDFLAVSLLV